jgi:hypothetical protein
MPTLKETSMFVAAIDHNVLTDQGHGRQRWVKHHVVHTDSDGEVRINPVTQKPEDHTWQHPETFSHLCPHCLEIPAEGHEQMRAEAPL